MRNKKRDRSREREKRKKALNTADATGFYDKKKMNATISGITDLHVPESVNSNIKLFADHAKIYRIVDSQRDADDLEDDVNAVKE